MKKDNLPTLNTGNPNPSVDVSKIERFEQIFKDHFKATGYQCVDSDVMIFLIAELSQFYYLSESNVRYTNTCNTLHT